MDTVNRKTKLVGILHIFLCFAITYIISILIIDEPITRQTADLLNIESLQMSAALTAFVLSSMLSLILTYFISFMVIGSEDEGTSWFSSNPLTKILGQFGLLCGGLGILAGAIHQVIKMIQEL